MRKKTPKSNNKAIEEAEHIYANLGWMKNTIANLCSDFEKRKNDVESRSPYTSSSYIENDVRVSGSSHRAPHESPTIQMRDDEQELIALAYDFEELVRAMNSAIEYAVIDSDARLGNRPRFIKALNASLKDSVPYKELAGLNINIDRKTLDGFREQALIKAAESIKILREDGNKALALFR